MLEPGFRVTDAGGNPCRGMSTEGSATDEHGFSISFLDLCVSVSTRDDPIRVLPGTPDDLIGVTP